MQTLIKPACCFGQSKEIWQENILGRPDDPCRKLLRWNPWALKLLVLAGGREDVWEPGERYLLGSRKKWLGDDKRISGNRELENPLAAVQMGLIYVNPEGPNGNPDPIAAANDIRETFGRMAMNDYETVALIAGGHTFGKTHGACRSGKICWPGTCRSGIEETGPWLERTIRQRQSGLTPLPVVLEVTWTKTPTKWSNNFFENLFGFEWELTKSPAGANQWKPK